MTCHEAPRTGSVIVSGNLNVCPTIDGIDANPAEVQVGGTIALSVVGARQRRRAGRAGLRLDGQRPARSANANTREPHLHLQRPGHRDRHR